MTTKLRSLSLQLVSFRLVLVSSSRSISYNLIFPPHHLQPLLLTPLLAESSSHPPYLTSHLLGARLTSHWFPTFKVRIEAQGASYTLVYDPDDARAFSVDAMDLTNPSTTSLQLRSRIWKTRLRRGRGYDSVVSSSKPLPVRVPRYFERAPRK